jgi:hypothetical protein
MLQEGFSAAINFIDLALQIRVKPAGTGHHL